MMCDKWMAMFPHGPGEVIFLTLWAVVVVMAFRWLLKNPRE